MDLIYDTDGRLKKMLYRAISISIDLIQFIDQTKILISYSIE